MTSETQSIVVSDIRDGYKIDYRRQVDGASRCDAVRLHLAMIRLTDVLELHIQCEFRLDRADTNTQRRLEVISAPGYPSR